MRQLLLKKALEAREKAYTPYSKFKVGAAILLKDNTIITGCNIENASYGLCNCAERTAMFKMVSEGYKKEDVEMMVVVADTALPCSPCGSCRQVMAELLPKNTPIILANIHGDMKETTIEELLPFAFSEVESNEL